MYHCFLLLKGNEHRTWHKYWQKESVDLEHIQLAQQNMSNSPVYISTFAHSSKHGHLIPYSFKEATCIFLQVSSTQESTTSVHGFLAQTGRQVQKVVGDGNCFFRCLSMQLFQSQDQHYAIRSVLARFENLSRGTFEKILMPAVNEPTFSGHIRKLITSCAWATHVEVMAAATYFQVPVYECCLDPSKTKYRWECIAPQSPPSHFRYPEVTEDMFTREVVVPNHFELVYIHNQHYDCIVSHETGKLSATLPTLMESHIFVTEIL